MRKFVQNMCKPLQNCCTCFDFTKMAPKNYFFWKSCINLVIFGQLKGNLGKFWWNLGKNGAWTASLWKTMRPVKCSRFLWKSFSLDSFSGKFVEIWAKILRTPKNLSAPPCFSCMRIIDETDIDCKLSASKAVGMSSALPKWKASSYLR